MPLKDLGNKHACFKCGTKFYDLKKSAPVCPKCGADQREAPVVKAPPAEKRQRAAARPVEPQVEEVEAEAVDEEVEADVDEADEAEEDEP